ncbi:MAG TPA: NUDIX hydrolase [Methylomirabilota bacterium]|nr:NUDIX hydrolase [Methylomirabilota bacterium]
MTAVLPLPAASVLLVRPGGRAPLEVYMIRRQKSMRFLGGYYAFPGGKLDPGDSHREMFRRCRGLAPDVAERAIPAVDGIAALSFWIAATRELLEETGVLVAHDGNGNPIDGRDPAVADRVESVRRRLLARVPLHELLTQEEWYLDLSPFRYLSHFITPPSSPIRFSARFFLAPVPVGQHARLIEDEASEGLWIEPAEGFQRFGRGEMPMAEPAYSGLAYLAEFESLEALWDAHVDGRHKIHGINDRLDALGLRVPRRPAGAPTTS